MTGRDEPMEHRRMAVSFPAGTEAWIQQACIASMIDPSLLRIGATINEIELVNLAVMEVVELLAGVGGIELAELLHGEHRIMVRLSTAGSRPIPDWDDAAAAIVDASLGEFRIERDRVVFTLSVTGDRTGTVGQ